MSNNRITDIFRQYGQEYYKQYKKRMPRTHVKALHAIQTCRTPEYGTIIAQCNDCSKQHVLYSACGNRHCPACQNHKTETWLGRQIEKALPCEYFLITFTVPEDIRHVIRSHQRSGYGALFDASAHALQALAGNPRFAGGGQAGFTGVLHTWGRQIQYHPHVHYVVPGGTLTGSKTKKNWAAAPPGFLLPVKALSKIFKAAYAERMQADGLLDLIPPNVWQRKWVVHCKPVGNAQHTLKYLARYVFKVAISNARIVNISNGMVTFKWQKSDSHRWRCTTVTAMEFIRRYLQHVLPDGFVKVRHYGFANHNAAINHRELFLLVLLAQDFEGPAPAIPMVEKPRPHCPHCGGALRYVRISRTTQPERTAMHVT